MRHGGRGSAERRRLERVKLGPLKKRKLRRANAKKLREERKESA